MGTRSLMPLIAAFVGLSTGCMTTNTHRETRLQELSKPTTAERINTTIKDAMTLGTTKPALATEFQCAWQTKLGQLPDPTRNGSMTSGIVGQVFIYTEKFQPADVTGSLAIVAYDATTRPQGVPARQPNVWHFDPETLKKMTVYDERFGKSLALFLPWPDEWTDVNRLQIQARYDQPGSHTLYAQQSTVTLDFFTTGNQVTTSQNRVTAQQLAANQVPDPKLLMSQLKNSAGLSGSLTPAGGSAVQQAAWVGPPPTNNVVNPAGGTMPPQMNNVPPPTMNTPPVQPGQQPQQEFQRMVIPRNGGR